MKKIKLIWDFRGPNATQTAKHHNIHLKEYITSKQLPTDTTGFTVLSDMHAIAYMVVLEDNMKTVRDDLKPHRGQIYISN